MYLLVSLFLDKKRYKHILARHNATYPIYIVYLPVSTPALRLNVCTCQQYLPVRYLVGIRCQVLRYPVYLPFPSLTVPVPVPVPYPSILFFCCILAIAVPEVR